MAVVDCGVGPRLKQGRRRCSPLPRAQPNLPSRLHVAGTEKSRHQHGHHAKAKPASAFLSSTPARGGGDMPKQREQKASTLRARRHALHVHVHRHSHWYKYLCTCPPGIGGQPAFYKTFFKAFFKAFYKAFYKALAFYKAFYKAHPTWMPSFPRGALAGQGRTGIECHESECHADGHGASVLCRLTGCIPVVTRSYLYSQSNPPELACAATPWLHLWLSSDQLQWTPCPCVSSQSSSQTFPQHMLLLMQTSTMGDTERERFSATEGHVVLVLLFRESQSGHVSGRGSAWHAPPMWRSHSTTYTSQSYAAM